MPECFFCKQIALCRSTCSSCELAMHRHCENTWLAGNAGSKKFCPSCKAVWKPRAAVKRRGRDEVEVEEEEEEDEMVEVGSVRERAVYLMIGHI